MQKFLQALEEARKAESMPQRTEADIMYEEMYKKYRALIGKRALYHTKATRDPRVVKIVAVYPKYVLLSYKYYGMDYHGETNTTSMFSSLICGEDRLEVE